MQVNYYTTSAPPVPGAVTGPGGSRQEGYGFVTFEECNVAEVVLTMGMHNVDGIEVMCSFSTERGSGSNPRATNKLCGALYADARHRMGSKGYDFHHHVENYSEVPLGCNNSNVSGKTSFISEMNVLPPTPNDIQWGNLKY